MNGILQVGSEAFAQPLLGPVLRPDQEAEPGVGDLVGQAGTEAAVARQQGLRDKDQAGAVGSRSNGQQGQMSKGRTL